MGEVLGSAVIPMVVVTGVKAGSFLLQSLRYSYWCLSWEGFKIFLGTCIGGVWDDTIRGSGVGATLISGAGVIVSSSVSGDVGTTLSSELWMVGGRRNLGGAVAQQRIWTTWMNAFLIVELKVSGEFFSVFDYRILNISSAVCLRYLSEVTVGNGTVCGNQSIVRTSQYLDVVEI